ncbi:MAG: YegP family protein [Desulfovibrio sp.]|nr:YegP family protein [Desulfovibrio sp.]
MGKFVIKNVASGIKFDLKANNHEVIATSEVYNSKAACKNGIESVRKNAPIAGLDDQTDADTTKVTHPRFELYADKAGEFRFRLTARNGEVIAVSEGYTTKAACKNGIESVRKNAPDAEVTEQS